MPLYGTALTVPQMHLVRATTSGNTAVVDTQETTLAFNTTSYGAADFDTTNHYYVAAVDGIYHFEANVWVGNLSGTGTLRLYKATGPSLLMSGPAGASTGFVATLNGDVYLAAGTQVFLAVYWAGTGGNLNTGGSAYVFWTGNLITPGTAS